MIDWKIMAASLAALLFVSSVFVGDFGLREFFGTITEKLGEWLGNSPFGGLFTAPTSSVIDADVVSLKIYPETFTLRPDHPVNITFGTHTITDFTGDISVDYVGNVLAFDEANSQLVLEMPIETTAVEGMFIKKLVIDNEKIDVSTGDWEISSNNGSIELYDFDGIAEIDSGMIALSGNISKLVRV